MEYEFISRKNIAVNNASVHVNHVSSARKVNVFIGIIVFFVFVVLMAAYDTATGNVNDENYGFSEDTYTLMSEFKH